MPKEYSTIRIWKATIKKLRFIRAYTGESIVAVLDRLATAELRRLKKSERNENLLQMQEDETNN